MTQTTESLTPGVEILHLDEMGYGPNGSMTRRAWRKACLMNLLADKEPFEVWQKQILAEHKGAEHVSFGLDVDDVERQNESWDTRDTCTLDFAGHEFSEHFDVDKFKFLLPSNFKYATFSGEAWFESANFSGEAWFDNATFSGSAWFESATFSGYVGFESATFSEYVWFKNAALTSGAAFRSAIFSGDAWFGSAAFGSYAGFESVIFSGHVGFESVTFSGNIGFPNATFCSGTLFESATFSENAWFQSATFSGDVVFGKAKFVGDSLFQSARFEKESDFENTVFEKVGHFEEARFKTEPPSFRGVDIATTRLEFSKTMFPVNSNTQQAVDDLSFLKRLSDEHGQADQALNFNAMELRAKRLLPDAAWSFKAVTWLYEVLSDFGRSFLKPLTAYFCLLTVTYALASGNAAFHSPKDCKGGSWRLLTDLGREEKPCNDVETKALEGKLQLTGYRAAAEYTLFRAAGVLDFSDTGKQTDAVSRRLFGQAIEPDGMRAWGVFKAIASTALLFLAALGLRNKYRIK